MTDTTSKIQIKNLAVAALFCALTFVATAFLPLPMGPAGYIHFGDAPLLLAIFFLPLPWACAAGALGSMLADVFLGYAVYAPWTLIIKAVMVLLAGFLITKLKANRPQWQALCLLPSAAAEVVGYYLAGIVLLGNDFAAGLACALNTLQFLVGGVIAVLINMMLQKRKDLKTGGESESDEYRKKDA